MKAKLISHSQAPEKDLDGGPSTLDLIAYCARVSNPENQANKIGRASCRERV